MACGAGDAALFATFLRRPDRQSGSKNPVGRMLGDLAYLKHPTVTSITAFCEKHLDAESQFGDARSLAAFPSLA